MRVMVDSPLRRPCQSGLPTRRPRSPRHGPGPPSRALLTTPPKYPDEWDYMKQQQAEQQARKVAPQGEDSVRRSQLATFHQQAVSMLETLLSASVGAGLEGGNRRR